MHLWLFNEKAGSLKDKNTSRALKQTKYLRQVDLEIEVNISISIWLVTSHGHNEMAENMIKLLYMWK
ncbi:MAG: hypothetical protein ACO1OT_17080 [Heyndrickxia sp.]